MQTRQISAAIRGIDVHVHLDDEMTRSRNPPAAARMADYFKTNLDGMEVPELAQYYRERNLMAVLVNTTNYTRTGIPPVPNDHIAAAVSQFPDVFLGMGAIDPWEGEAAVKEVRRCARELGLVGIGELNPGRQAFYPDDRRFFPIWEAAEEEGLVLMLHSGMAGFGAGTPGGSGLELGYTRPIPHMDSVAANFPGLRIICAHPSWPWQDEALAMALHKSNVYIDLSGYAPKYFPEALVRNMTRRLQDRVLFGTDFPMLQVDRWLNEFHEIEMDDDVRSKILLRNAAEIYGLTVQ